MLGTPANNTERAAVRVEERRPPVNQSLVPVPLMHCRADPEQILMNQPYGNRLLIGFCGKKKVNFPGVAKSLNALNFAAGYSTFRHGQMAHIVSSNACTSVPARICEPPASNGYGYCITIMIRYGPASFAGPLMQASHQLQAVLG